MRGAWSHSSIDADTSLSRPASQDNYAYLVVCRGRRRERAVVDASEAEPVERAALRTERASSLVVAIWSTHHHLDHVGGNEEVVRAAASRSRRATCPTAGACPAQTRFVEYGRVRRASGSVTARCFTFPGTRSGRSRTSSKDGDERAVFTGDTLFVAGCGRLFEGTPAQMHASLSSLAELPDRTRASTAATSTRWRTSASRITSSRATRRSTAPSSAPPPFASAASRRSLRPSATRGARTPFSASPCPRFEPPWASPRTRPMSMRSQPSGAPRTDFADNLRVRITRTMSREPRSDRGWTSARPPPWPSSVAKMRLHPCEPFDFMTERSRACQGCSSAETPII